MVFLLAPCAPAFPTGLGAGAGAAGASPPLPAPPVPALAAGPGVAPGRTAAPAPAAASAASAPSLQVLSSWSLNQRLTILVLWQPLAPLMNPLDVLVIGDQDFLQLQLEGVRLHFAFTITLL